MLPTVSKLAICAALAAAIAATAAQASGGWDYHQHKDTMSGAPTEEIVYSRYTAPGVYPKFPHDGLKASMRLSCNVHSTAFLSFEFTNTPILANTETHDGFLSVRMRTKTVPAGAVIQGLFMQQWGSPLLVQTAPLNEPLVSRLLSREEYWVEVGLHGGDRPVFKFSMEGAKEAWAKTKCGKK